MINSRALAARGRLHQWLKAHEATGVAVAFSGGVDSSYLLAEAQSVIPGRVLAITAKTAIVPAEEIREAVRLAHALGVRHCVEKFDVMALVNVRRNPPDRCYHCKRFLFKALMAKAAQMGFGILADGSNADDDQDYRPGRRAVVELGVATPLKDAGLCKADIRELSREMGLPTAAKPSMACLASRIPYGTELTMARLQAVAALESMLRREGFPQVRVRHHGQVARVEVEPGAMPRLLDEALRRKVARTARRAGFLYVALDLTGYVTGSMNRAILKKARPAASAVKR